MNAMNNTVCPSKFDLAHWAAEHALSQEKPADTVAQHVSACGRCQAYVEELSEARQMLLGDDPARASLNAARTILQAAEQRKSSWFNWNWKLLWPVAMLPAAALIGVFAIVDRTPQSTGASVALNETAQVAATSVRTKGSFALTIVCKRGDAMTTLADGENVREGDRLRFEYTQSKPGFVMVFSVDDSGKIFPYYDEASLQSVAAVAGNQVALPGSIELDAHKGLERVFALWSETPLDGQSVRAAVAEALAKAGGDLHQVQKLSVGSEQTSYLLNRP